MTTSHDVVFQPFASIVRVQSRSATRTRRRVKSRIKVQARNERLLTIEVLANVNDRERRRGQVRVGQCQVAVRRDAERYGPVPSLVIR